MRLPSHPSQLAVHVAFAFLQLRQSNLQRFLKVAITPGPSSFLPDLFQELSPIKTKMASQVQRHQEAILPTTQAFSSQSLSLSLCVSLSLPLRSCTDQK